MAKNNMQAQKDYDFVKKTIGSHQHIKHNSKLWNKLNLNNNISNYHFDYIFMPKAFENIWHIFVQKLDILKPLISRKIININVSDLYLVGVSIFKGKRVSVDFAKIVPKFDIYSDSNDNPDCVLSWEELDGRTDASSFVRQWYPDNNSLKIADDITDGLSLPTFENLHVNQSVDFMGNLLISGIKDFYVGNDFYKQALDYENILKNSSYKNTEGWAYVPITYNECKNYQKDKNFLFDKYKSAKKLKHDFKLDFNKLTYYDFNYLKQLTGKLTKNEFFKFYNYFIKNKKQIYIVGTNLLYNYEQSSDYNAEYDYIDIALSLYCAYLAKRAKIDTDIEENGNIIINYVNNLIMSNRRKKISVKYNGLRQFQDQLQILKHQNHIKRLKKQYGLKNFNTDVISNRQKWNKLLKNIKSNKNITVMRTPNDLIKEGETQQNCLSTYIRNYVDDTCGLILHYDDKKHNEQDSLEVVIDESGQYIIKQIYAKYDHQATKSNIGYLENIFNK